MFVTKNRTGVGMVFLIAVLTFITACGPPGPRALLAGRKLLESGQTDEALKELKTAVSLLPTNAAAWNYLGLAYHRAGQSTNASEAYSRAIKLDRDLLEARFNLGCLWLDENRLDAARTEFTAYTLRRGNETEGWLKLGSVHVRAHEAGAAEKCFREVLRLETNNVEAANGLGLVQWQRNRPRDAADFFTAALKQEPGYRPALLNLATVSQQLNDRPEALRRYHEYLALQPRPADWDAVNALVRSLEQPAVAPATPPPRPATNNVVNHSSPVIAASTNQSKTQALAAVTRISPVTKPESNTVTVRPVPAPVTAPPAFPKITNPPPPEVVKLAPDPLIKTTPVEPKPSVVSSNPVSRAARTSDVPPTAQTERRGFFSKLNPFRGDSKPATNGNSLSATGTVDSSASEKRLPPVAPGRYAYLAPSAPKAGDRREAEVALSQGQQAQRANRNAEALQSFRRATLLDPTYFEAYYCLGLTAFKARSFQAALSAWENALALRPDNSDARYNFALTLKATNYAQDAADELEKLLSLHPDEARGHLTLGNLYAEQLRNIPRARQHYNKVLQLDPRNPQAPAIRYWLVANPG